MTKYHQLITKDHHIITKNPHIMTKFHHIMAAVVRQKYCQYVVKLYPINQPINQSSYNDKISSYNETSHQKAVMAFPTFGLFPFSV